MKNKEVKKLHSGLYEIYWKDEVGISLAAIGTKEDGTRWIAPCNWLCPAIMYFQIDRVWKQVKSVRLIREA